jgi:hypothetical protein
LSFLHEKDEKAYISSHYDRSKLVVKVLIPYWLQDAFDFGVEGARVKDQAD